MDAPGPVFSSVLFRNNLQPLSSHDSQTRANKVAGSSQHGHPIAFSNKDRKYVFI